MAGYPDTLLKSGVADPAFGGQPANKFGTPQHTFQDAQIRELQKEVIDDQWASRRYVRCTITTGGNAGDAIVYDTTQALGGGVYPFRKLATGGYTVDVTIIVGVLAESVSAGAIARVVFFGPLSPTITSLPATSGPITIDTSTGRLRAAAVGETRYGVADTSGNCLLLCPGFIP